jgi:hypothetical protein
MTKLREMIEEEAIGWIIRIRDPYFDDWDLFPPGWRIPPGRGSIPKWRLPTPMLPVFLKVGLLPRELLQMTRNPKAFGRHGER